MSGVIAQSHNVLLDRVMGMLEDPQTLSEGMTSLMSGLSALRRSSNVERWRELAATIRQHPLVHTLHQDPCSLRACTKPRGYAGDAVLLDYFYEDKSRTSDLEAATRAGNDICKFVVNRPSPVAARLRRDVIARRIDERAEIIARPEILSIACGHLREAQKSKAVAERRVGRFIALDHDPESLKVVHEELSGFGIEGLQCSIFELLSEKTRLPPFDFIYSSGLFDYLTAPVATSLAYFMFDLLKPGGRMLITNFMPDISDSGYLETFMDWWLIYRSKDELKSVAKYIPIESIADVRVWSEDSGNLAFLEILRK